MRICHITDLHIPDQGNVEQLSHVKTNISRQLEYVSASEPDLLVISGDLTIPDASESGCNWLAAELPRNVASIVMPGNHDSPEVLWSVFGPTHCRSERFYFTIDNEPLPLIFLDTHLDILPDEQISFLRSREAGPAVVFMHHPPDLISDGFMSRNQPMQNHGEAAQALRDAGVTHVFCGHYHNVAEIDCDGFTLHLSPSPAFQISLDEPEFTPQPFTPSVRVIEITDGCEVTTELIEV